MSARTRRLEEEFGVSLPRDYAEFLDTYGIYQDDGLEVYGLNDEMADTDGIPSVIGATKIVRKRLDLPPEWIVIHHTGYEGEVVCLDTSSGKVWLVWDGGKEEIDPSFAQWFAKMQAEAKETE
jgi:hypothetical protein